MHLTASRIQSQPATLLPLDVETQARRTEVPESLKELVGVPHDRNPKTGQFEFPEERDLNSEERGPPLGPASDDDEPASDASSDLMNLLPTPINEHPGYIVQYTLKMLGIGKGWSGTYLMRAGDIFPLTGVSIKSSSRSIPTGPISRAHKLYSTGRGSRVAICRLGKHLRSQNDV